VFISAAKSAPAAWLAVTAQINDTSKRKSHPCQGPVNPNYFMLHSWGTLDNSPTYLANHCHMVIQSSQPFLRGWFNIDLQLLQTGQMAYKGGELNL